MRQWSARAAFVAWALTTWTPAAGAAPRHDFCGDAGDRFFFGVSSYGDLRAWAGEANAAGADFRMLYVYVLAAGMENPSDFEQYYLRPFAEAAISIDATPVFTFYQLLDIGRAAGFTGSESEVVREALQDDGAMRTYFDNFVWFLQFASSLDRPPLIQVEPDSWGFMMWAFGVEGNGDATSVPVSVGSSGHPDVAGFPDHAAGLGQALLSLREKYAPDARMGFHASNFRVGARPEVVADFYASVGEWDVLVSEEPHVTGDNWWDPWPSDALQTNLDWMKAVTEAAGVPLLLWQMPIGFEGNLLDPAVDPSNLVRFAEAGVVGLLFEHIAHRGEDDPDQIRADGDAGAVPPAGTPTDGTAKGLRERLIAYAGDPLSWPDGSPCATGSGGEAGVGAGGSAEAGDAGQPSTETGGADASGGSPAAGATGGGTTGGSISTAGAQDAGSGGRAPSTGGTSSSAKGSDGSCACALPGAERGRPATGALAAVALGLLGLRRRRRSRLPRREARTMLDSGVVRLWWMLVVTATACGNTEDRSRCPEVADLLRQCCARGPAELAEGCERFARDLAQHGNAASCGEAFESRTFEACLP